MPFKENQLETVTSILKAQCLISNTMLLLYMHCYIIFQDSENQNGNSNSENRSGNSICKIQLFDTYAIKQLQMNSSKQ